jgi:hypothetical protein
MKVAASAEGMSLASAVFLGSLLLRQYRRYPAF